MNLKKILNILIFLTIITGTFCCPVCNANTDLQRTREQINRLKWLERLESDKLYNNQRKLENANHSLSSSKKQIDNAQKELNDLQEKLDKASREYSELNYILAQRIRYIYKSQNKAFLEMLLSSEDINMFFDRQHFRQIILNNDLKKLKAAKNKALEIAEIKYNIETKKRRLERSVNSINSQQAYIKKAIKKNEDMIYKLKNDRVAYEKAEKELAKQSASIGSYINKTTKDTSTQVASGFVKPIQGRITSPFGWRTHPIFNSRSFHSGIDIGGPNYGNIVASNSGKVIYSGWYGGYGKVVIIDHGSINGKPVTTLYAHMSSILVSNGQKVNKGQVIGKEGTTGYSTGPHCHFEVRVNGQPNNPQNYI